MADTREVETGERPEAAACPGTLLIVSQVYVPDPAAVGQHLHDAAAEMARRGWRVVVVTSARGYDDPTLRHARREVRDGVEIVRLPLSSFGKRTIALRLLAHALFLFQAFVRGLFTRRVSRLLVSTSPPACAALGVALSFLRGIPLKYWVMDLNPDQAIARGVVARGSLPARVFDALNRWVLGRARDVVVLDRFMAERVNAKRPVAEKLTVLPPWPHDDHLAPVERDANPFREKHALGGRLVLGYSGNMSLASPLTTFLRAALALRDDPRLFFLFIGGGNARREVEQALERERPTNALLLPYQPLAEIRFSLSAADVHVVTMGDDMVGMIHPCKVYGAMAVARPILYFGPEPSHLSDLVEEGRIGWRVAHGDVDGAVAAMRRLADMPRDVLESMGREAREVVTRRLSKARLCGAFCDVLER